MTGQRKRKPRAITAPGAIPQAEYITERELAAWVGIAMVTLQQMRWRGSGPPYLKFGTRAIRYHVPSVRAWLDARTVAGAAAR